MPDRSEIRFFLRTAKARRATGITVALTLALVWVLCFFANHDTQLRCERRGNDGTCVFVKRYPIGERDRSYALSDVHDVSTRQRSTKNGARWDVMIEAGSDTLDIDTFGTQKGADAEVAQIRAFLRDPERSSYATPVDPNPPSLVLTMAVAAPITLLFLLIFILNLRSTTVTIDEQRRVIRLTRHEVVWRKTIDVPLDEVAAVKVENSNVPVKRGTMRVSNAWLVRADGSHVTAVNPDWATRGLCDEPAARLDAWIRATTRASTSTNDAPNAPPIEGDYRAPPTHEGELQALVSHRTPRDRAFAEPYARKLEPASHFIGLGLLFAYLSLCAFTAVAVLGTIGVMAILGRPPPPPESLLLSMFVAGIAAFVGVWLIFRRIVRSRRARAAHLYTHGNVIEGAFARFRVREGESVVTATANVVFSPSPGVTKTASVVLHGAHPLSGGERCAVLYEPTYGKIVAYPLEGDVRGTIVTGTLL